MSKPFSKKLPEKVQSRLRERGYASLADLSTQTGIPSETLKNVFCNNQHKSLVLYITLAKSFGVTVEDLPDLLGL